MRPSMKDTHRGLFSVLFNRTGNSLLYAATKCVNGAYEAKPITGRLLLCTGAVLMCAGIFALRGWLILNVVKNRNMR